MSARRAARQPILVVAQGEDGIDLALVDRDGRRTRVRGHERLLSAIVGLLPAGRRPRGIVVLGRAARFSESRSVATLANVLAFAWDVPVAAAAESPAALSADRIGRALARAHGPIRPAYSAEPNITRPKGGRDR